MGGELCDAGTLRLVVEVDHRSGAKGGNTWPGGWQALRVGAPRVKRHAPDVNDARFIYISYALLADLRYFEQVKFTLPKAASCVDFNPLARRGVIF